MKLNHPTIRAVGARDPVVIFEVEGVFPSLENWRQRSTYSKGRDKEDQAKNRVRSFKEEVGWAAKQASNNFTRREVYGARVAVHIWMHRQRIDLDNEKLMIDALKHILYPDDRKKFVKKIILEDVTELYGDKLSPRVFFMVRPHAHRRSA